MIEVVVFDLAGTTVRDQGYVYEAFHAALLQAGLELSPDEVNPLMGYAKPEAIAILLEKHKGVAEPDEIDRIHEAFVEHMLEFYRTTPDLAEMPGAASLFTKLQEAGIQVALDTGFSRDIAKVIFQRLGWKEGETYQASVTSDEVERGRPYPDMIREIMAYLDIEDPKRVAKIGDTPVDLEEGQRAGCGINIGITTGSFSRQDLSLYPHTHIIAQLDDALSILIP